MRANQLRSWFAAMAYMLVCALRRIALRHIQFAQATCGTIGLKLFKIGALVRVGVRRIKIATAADFGGSRSRIREDVAQHSDSISLGVPR